VREQEIVMRKLDALNKLYHRPPTNEHIERDFHKELHDAWLAVACLYDYLEALHKDDLLYCPNNFVETALEDLKEVRDRLGQDQGCYFELDLPRTRLRLSPLRRLTSTEPRRSLTPASIRETGHD
jgi:hypothetical protein